MRAIIYITNTDTSRAESAVWSVSLVVGIT
jgi:hypothetical protein